RSFSGLLYILLLLISFKFQIALITVLFVFGIVCIVEFNRLIQLKSLVPYILFIVLYVVFGYWQLSSNSRGLDESTQILTVLSIFVNLFLIKDLFSTKTIPLFSSKRYLLTTFYLSSSFVFLILIAHFHEEYNPYILFGTFILVWTNDTFAFIVGKKFGRQKLFEKISPKKTVEGFMGGLFFSCIASYFIATFAQTLSFTNWL